MARSRSRLVAAMTRTSEWSVRTDPTRSNVPSCSTRRSLACRSTSSLADLVQEERSAVGDLEAAGPGGDRAREGALLVAEELRLDQRRWDGGAVDPDERAGAAGAALVDRAGEELLPRTGFTEEQDCRVGRGHLRHPREHEADRAALADDLVEVVRRPHFLSQRDVLFLEAISERVDFLDMREQAHVAALTIVGAGQDLTDDPQAVDVDGRPLAGPREVPRRDHALDLPSDGQRQRDDGPHPEARRICALSDGLCRQVGPQIGEDDVPALLELLEKPGEVPPDRERGAGFDLRCLRPRVRRGERREIRGEFQERGTVRAEPLHDRPETDGDFFVEAAGLDSDEPGRQIADHVLECAWSRGHVDHPSEGRRAESRHFVIITIYC